MRMGMIYPFIKFLFQVQLMSIIKKYREKSIFTFQPLEKSDFQPKTIKADTKDHLTIQTGIFGPLGGFEDGLQFYKNRKNIFKLQNS